MITSQAVKPALGFAPRGLRNFTTRSPRFLTECRQERLNPPCKYGLAFSRIM